MRILILLLAAACFVQANELHITGDDNWILSVGHGERVVDPLTGDLCLTLDGTSGILGSSHWRWAMDFRAGTVYELRAEVRTSTGSSGGALLLGTSFVNRDVHAQNEWIEFAVRFRAPQFGRDYIRVGQWHLDGTAWFRNIRLSVVQPIHRVTDGIELGTGEVIENNRYTAAFSFRQQVGNYNRCLHRFDASFNTYRWDFRGVSNLIFRHQLPASQSNGELVFKVHYTQMGLLAVEASKDADNWVSLGNFREEKQFSVKIPAELYPAETIFVRFRNLNPVGRIQIDKYAYSADLLQPVAEQTGLTQFYRVEQNTDILQVELQHRAAGSDKPLALVIKNPARERISINIESGGKHQRVNLDGTAGQTVPLSRLQAEAPLTVTHAATGEVVYQIQPDKNRPILERIDYGHFLQTENGVTLWWTDSARKIGSSRPAPLPGTSRPMRIELAKNETEALQLVLRSEQPLQNIRARVEPLRHNSGRVLPEQAVQLLQVEYVNIETPTDKLGQIGLWPDPLPPLPDEWSLQAGKNQPLWLGVFVPAGYPAGIYRGAVTLRVEGQTVRLPVAVEVWDFTVPEEWHLQAATSFDLWLAKDYHHLKSSNDVLELSEKYFQNFARHRVSPYDPFALHPINVEFDREHLSARLDFRKFDAAVNKYLFGYGFNNFRLNVTGLGGGNYSVFNPGRLAGFDAGTPEYEILMRSYLSQIEAHFEELDILDRAYIYWFDEPDPDDYPIVVETMQRLQKYAPKLTRMLTEQPEPELFGHVDLWCPVTYKYDHQLAQERRAAGERFWWYICSAPHEPYATLFIDHYGVEMRTWLWQSWKYGIEGVLIWQSNYWTSPLVFEPPALQNPYKDPMSYKRGYGLPQGYVGFWGNGDGRLIYPPKRVFESNEPNLEGPVNSIRFEMLRDGIEDYEYLWLLRDRIQKLRHADGDAELLAEAEQLLTVPASITASLTDFTTDAGPIYEHRRKLAEMIVRLNRRIETR